uniref:Uncharacterized protein n=1 Tax=Magallana gigas TaxID=29159 RepID=K1QMG3_MAGGI
MSPGDVNLNVLDRQADKVAAMLVTVWNQTPVAVTLVIEDPSVTTGTILTDRKCMWIDIYNYTTDATTESGSGSGDSATIWANFNRFNKIRGTVSAAFGMESKLSSLPSYVTSSKIGWL